MVSHTLRFIMVFRFIETNIVRGVRKCGVLSQDLEQFLRKVYRLCKRQNTVSLILRSTTKKSVVFMNTPRSRNIRVTDAKVAPQDALLGDVGQ